MNMEKWHTVYLLKTLSLFLMEINIIVEKDVFTLLIAN